MSKRRLSKRTSAPDVQIDILSSRKTEAQREGISLRNVTADVYVVLPVKALGAQHRTNPRAYERALAFPCLEPFILLT